MEGDKLASLLPLVRGIPSHSHQQRRGHKMHAVILGWKKKYTKGTVIRSIAEFQEVLERDNLVYVPGWNAPVHKGWISGLRYRDIERMISRSQIYTAVLKNKPAASGG